MRDLLNKLWKKIKRSGVEEDSPLEWVCDKISKFFARKLIKFASCPAVRSIFIYRIFLGTLWAFLGRLRRALTRSSSGKFNCIDKLPKRLNCIDPQHLLIRGIKTEKNKRWSLFPIALCWLSGQRWTGIYVLVSSSDAPLIFPAVKCSERYKYLASKRIGKREIFPQCFFSLVLFTAGKDGKSNYIGEEDGEKLMEILSMSAESWKLKASRR